MTHAERLALREAQQAAASKHAPLVQQSYADLLEQRGNVRRHKLHRVLAARVPAAAGGNHASRAHLVHIMVTLQRPPHVSDQHL